ncbi:MAG: hypothetical protein ACYDB2_03825 [Acidimicrobiales bacterium]
MPNSFEGARDVGISTVFVIPVGPECQPDFVADTIESIRYFAPMARTIVVDGSRRGLGQELAMRYHVTALEARAYGHYGSLYLNLSDGFREALTRPFRILVRLDTDALIAGSDFEAKAIGCFDVDKYLGSLGSFRIGYDCLGVRNARWAQRRTLLYLASNAFIHPRQALMVANLLQRAHKHGYKLGDSIMGGAAVYRYEAVQDLNGAGLLGRLELARMGLQEDYIFGICLFSIGYHLGEFGNRFDDLPMGVDWKNLPAAPKELIELGKSIIHSTKNFEGMDEQAIRKEFRSVRQQA